MTGTESQQRVVIGVRTGRGAPLLWCDPLSLDPQPGQHVHIATEDGEQLARVAIGLTEVSPDVPVAAVTVLGLTDDESAAALAASLPTVEAVESPAHHLHASVAHDRIASFISRLLAVRREGREPLPDLGDALGSEDPDAS